MQNKDLIYSTRYKCIMMWYDREFIKDDERIAQYLGIDVRFYRQILRRFNCNEYNNNHKRTIFKDKKWGNKAVEHLIDRYILIERLVGE